MSVDFGAQLAIALGRRESQKNSNVSTIYSRKQIEQGFLEAFELIGGVPRLAIWANDEENYGEFLKLLIKMAPKEQIGQMQGQILEYRSNVPTSPLNRAAPPAQEIEDGVYYEE